jgi:hypothetical protein
LFVTQYFIVLQFQEYQKAFVLVVVQWWHSKEKDQTDEGVNEVKFGKIGINDFDIIVT